MARRPPRESHDAPIPSPGALASTVIPLVLSKGFEHWAMQWAGWSDGHGNITFHAGEKIVGGPGQLTLSAAASYPAGRTSLDVVMAVAALQGVGEDLLDGSILELFEGSLGVTWSPLTWAQLNQGVDPSSELVRMPLTDYLFLVADTVARKWVLGIKPLAPFVAQAADELLAAGGLRARRALESRWAEEGNEEFEVVGGFVPESFNLIDEGDGLLAVIAAGEDIRAVARRLEDMDRSWRRGGRGPDDGDWPEVPPIGYVWPEDLSPFGREVMSIPTAIPMYSMIAQEQREYPPNAQGQPDWFNPDDFDGAVDALHGLGARGRARAKPSPLTLDLVRIARREDERGGSIPLMSEVMRWRKLGLRVGHDAVGYWREAFFRYFAQILRWKGQEAYISFSSFGKGSRNLGAFDEHTLRALVGAPDHSTLWRAVGQDSFAGLAADVIADHLMMEACVIPMRRERPRHGWMVRSGPFIIPGLNGRNGPQAAWVYRHDIMLSFSEF